MHRMPSDKKKSQQPCKRTQPWMWYKFTKSISPKFQPNGHPKQTTVETEDEKIKTHPKESLSLWAKLRLFSHLFFWLISFSWRKTHDKWENKKLLWILAVRQIADDLKVLDFCQSNWTHVKVIIARFLASNCSSNCCFGSLWFGCTVVWFYLFSMPSILLSSKHFWVLVFSIICSFFFIISFGVVVLPSLVCCCCCSLSSGCLRMRC